MLCKQPLFCTKVIVRRVLVWRGEAEPLVQRQAHARIPNEKFIIFLISIQNNKIYDISVRTLHLCKALAEKLKEFRDVYNELRKNDKHFSHSGAIFCNVDGTPRFPHYLNHLLKKHLMNANCEPVSCHRIRHTWISKLINEGIPASVVSKMAGHANTDITLKIYTHYNKSADNSVEVLDRIYSNRVS